MTEDSEQLSVIPKKFIVIRLKKHKYGCESCHETIITVPTPPRIKPGSSYGDEMIIDVAVAKYDYLLPIERYVRMAEDRGVTGLPQQSLIETTHYLADKLMPIYEGIKNEVLAAKVLHADETPHRMLEGDKKKSWYLWGFSCEKSSYFELHSTRSGEVASTLLIEACATYLVSDVYSGYKKAVTDANRERAQKGLVQIENLYCNAHARRKFDESKEVFPAESEYFLEQYERIYKPGATREEMRVIFKEMHVRALELMLEVPEKSVFGRGLSYFLKNYEGLTRCLRSENLPLDNNSQERQMRNPVVGRKTWYGTHSKRGAKTAAVMFTIIESCKLNGLNSNEYLEAQVENLNYGRPVQTPTKFKTRNTQIQ
jgi:transposase